MYQMNSDLKALILKYAKKKDIVLSGGTSFINDLGYDSITLIRLITDIEETFSFQFDEEYLNIALIATCKQLNEYVGSKTLKRDTSNAK